MKNGTIFRHLGVMGEREESDEDLLRAFIENRNEKAFTAIVRRHGPLVQRVCQSALQHRQDAEDAFQGTFMVLARKAASITKGQSLLSWLHGVAYRLTTEMKRNASRRQIKLTQVKTMPRQISSDPSEELSWREVEALLHKEIERLPAKYRDAFVLCALGGNSRSDVARNLGILEGTLSSRLAHARKLLQNRLARRGVSLAAVLGAIDVSQRAWATIRPRLVESVVNVAMSQTAKGSAIACAVGAGLLTIIEGVERSMSSSKMKTMLASLVTVGLIAAGLGGLADYSSAGLSEPIRTKPSVSASEQPATNTARNDDAKSITVQGTVLGPDGKPVSGAKLYLGQYSPKDEITVIESAKSDTNGHFRFTFTKNVLSKAHPDPVVADFPPGAYRSLEPQPRDNAVPHFTPVGQLMAVAEGLGCDWARIDLSSETAELTLRLVKDVPINGSILDKEGKPVVGAKIHLSRLNAYSSEDFKKALAGFSKSNEFQSGEWNHGLSSLRTWGGQLPGQARIVTTGKDGAFSITGLGADRYASLHIEGPGIATTVIPVLTRLSDDLVGPDKITIGEGGGTETGTEISIEPKRIYGATFRYRAAPSRVIRGVISDKETGRPLAGVLVRVGPDKNEMMTAYTDKDGRYEVQGCRKSSSYEIAAQPADAGLYFTIFSSGISDTPGLAPMTINLELPRGIPIRGKVVDERTGKPLPGARVFYYPFWNYAGVKQLYAGLDQASAQSSAIAGPDGSYAVAALPGEGFLCTVAPDFKNKGKDSRSLRYKQYQLSDQELNDYLEKYNLSSSGPLGSSRRITGNDLDLLNYIASSDEGGFEMAVNFVNRVTFVYPGEKDKELKLDLKLTPVGDEKAPDPKKGK